MILEKIYKFTKEKNTVNALISQTIIDKIIKEKVFSMNIIDLAESSGCSQSSVSKYIKGSLEVESYRVLINILNNEISSYFANNYNFSNFEEDNKTILKDIKDTLSHLDSNKVKEAAELIVKAGKINVAAIGGNIALKSEIEHKLSQIGKFVMIGPDWHQQLININFMEKNDIVIAISYSGDKFEMNKILEKARDKGVIVITFTGMFNSHLKEKANYNFEILSSDSKYRSFSFTSRLCAFAVWGVIFKSMLALDIITSDVIEAWKWEQN